MKLSHITSHHTSRHRQRSNSGREACASDGIFSWSTFQHNNGKPSLFAGSAFSLNFRRCRLTTAVLFAVFLFVVVLASVYVVVLSVLSTQGAFRANIIDGEKRFLSKSTSDGFVIHSRPAVGAAPSWRNLLRSLHPSRPDVPDDVSSNAVSPNNPKESGLSTSKLISNHSEHEKYSSKSFERDLLEAIKRRDAKLENNKGKKKRKVATLVTFAADEHVKAFKGLKSVYCDQLRPPRIQGYEGTRSERASPWQNPEGTKWFLYSAYLDTRLPVRYFSFSTSNSYHCITYDPEDRILLFAH